MNSTHLFRAIFLLVFGLMIGEVFGGGGPFKITVVGNSQGIPTYHTLNDTLIINQSNQNAFSENLALTVDGFLPTGIWNLELKVYSSAKNSLDTLSYFENFTTQSNKLSNILNFKNYSFQFNGIVAGSYSTNNLICEIRISSLITNQIVIINKYSLPVKFVSQNLKNNRTSLIEGKEDNSIVIELFDGQSVLFDKLVSGEYLLECYSYEGRLIFFHKIKVNDQIKIKRSLNNVIFKNKIIFFRLRSENSDSYSRTIKKMIY